ncbi:MAG: DUF3857 domain-containing protein, partial [Candidatus Dormibacteria bacterium]
SKEAFVIENSISHITFENDGTSTEEGSLRVHILSQAGLQQWGMLNFPYASAESTADIVYVRVDKPDGQVIQTPAENILVMPADVTRTAPFYSDLMIKQVAVKSLEIGDTLEYQYRSHTNTPVAPGQFWYVFNFFKAGIDLHEELQIRVPLGRDVKLKSPALPPVVSEDGPYRVYTWETSHEELKAGAKSEDENPDKIPSVQLSSFRSWDEVGQWFQGLLAPRVEVTPEIKAKAEEVTRDAPTQAQKIQALYSYVSGHYRYIGIDLGIGRYQPHPASVVLTNDYGDCKDKHTLFAALLAAINVKAYPALMKSSGEIDADVPYPSQFNHVVTVIPQGNSYLWLDTTPEVAPFGYLEPTLRDKKALVIPDKGAAQFLETPTELPFPSYVNFKAEGSLSDDGTYTGHMQITARGDFELLLRTILRGTAQSQWTAVMQKVSQALGFGGAVDDVTATPPEKTDVPFHVEYSYTRKDFGDWSHKQIIPALPVLPLPDAPDNSGSVAKPIPWLGDQETTLVGTIQLPKGFDAKASSPVSLLNKFAEYQSSTSLIGGALHTERHLLIKEREIPAAQFSAYKVFRQAVIDDETTFITLSNGITSAVSDSDGPDAEALYEQGREAMKSGDIKGAVDAYQKTVDQYPHFSYGWFALGAAHFQMGERDQGLKEMNKAIDLNPGELHFYEFLSVNLERSQRLPDALNVWKQMQKEVPQNPTPPENIARL